MIRVYVLTWNEANKLAEVVGASAGHGWCCCCCCCTPPAIALSLCSIPSRSGSIPPPSTAWLASWLREGRPTRATDVPHDVSRRANGNTPSPSQRAMLPSTATDCRRRLVAFLGRVFLRRSILSSALFPASSLSADGMAWPQAASSRQRHGDAAQRKKRRNAFHMQRYDWPILLFSEGSRFGLRTRDERSSEAKPVQQCAGVRCWGVSGAIGCLSVVRVLLLEQQSAMLDAHDGEEARDSVGVSVDRRSSREGCRW